MILNSISKIIDDGRDYVVLIDYGYTEGISVLSQHLNISDAMKAMNECYGLSKAVVKVCRISDPIEM